MYQDNLNHHRRPSIWNIHTDTPFAKHRFSRDMQRSRQASTCSERSCEGMSIEDTQDLWRCMLELQQRYGCYTSARIDVALEAGDEGLNLMPNRFIIDTLNESVVDLPEEGREMLNRFLSPAADEEERKRKWKFWKKE